MPERDGAQPPGSQPDWLSETIARIGAYSPRQRATTGLARAAVLVPILISEDAPPRLLFLVRPTTLTAHSGQVAFPGGKIDPDDADPSAAALREAEEELGIARGLPRIIGQLDEMNTHTGFHVTPIVALLRTPLLIVPSPAEVAAHFEVPLPTLFDPAERRSIRGTTRIAQAPAPALVSPAAAAPRELRLHFWVNTPAPIWGVTGLILDNLLRIIEAHE